MTDIKRILVVWNDENYSNRQEAEEDGAVSQFEIPSNYDIGQQLAFVEGVTAALRASGERLANNNRALAFEEIVLKPYVATARVLEWNDYTATVWAVSDTAAQEQVRSEGILSYSTDDVSWGTESAPSDILITQKDVHVEPCN